MSMGGLEKKISIVLIAVLLLLSLSVAGEVTKEKEGDGLSGLNWKNTCFRVLPWQCANHEKPWQKYFKAIRAAEKKYKDCNETCYEEVLTKSLLPWKDGITQGMVVLLDRQITMYQIIDGKLYRSKNCMFPSRCAGIEHFILELLSNKWKGEKLGDMEFILNTRDNPMIYTHQYRNQVPPPLFSFSITPQYLDIMYPAWTFWEGGPALSSIERTGIGRWDLKFKTIGKSAKKWPWSKKKSVAFFRGSRTSTERDKLVYLSRDRPNLFNATYVKNQAWKSNADTLGPPSTEISLEDHCEFKYLFNFRGVAASFRFKHLFLCKSLVFHVGDEWLEFFYPELKPWVHYIPVKQDLSDAEELVEFALANDILMKRIAMKGYNFINNHLQLSDVLNYWHKLLISYSSLLKYKPTLDPSLVHIYPGRNPYS